MKPPDESLVGYVVEFLAPDGPLDLVVDAVSERDLTGRRWDLELEDGIERSITLPWSAVLRVKVW